MAADYPARCNDRFQQLIFQEKHEAVPNSVRYPIEGVISALEAVGGPGSVGDYFASSISYMMALAIYQKRPEVHIYGVDLIAEEEWGYQRPNLEYLIGLARGNGMVVYIPPESALLRFTHRYGYENWASAGALNPRVLREHAKDYIQKRDHHMAGQYIAEGALQATRNLLRLMERGGRSYSKPEESEGEPTNETDRTADAGPTQPTR
jgi:hypothetical protein